MSHTTIVPLDGPSESEGAAEAVTWERQYLQYLHEHGQLSGAAIAELTRCTDRIFGHVPDSEARTANQRLSGALVGAVQSGKTGVMISLAARALDIGYRFIIVLAGLRNDLREQTALRFTTQLLWRGDEVFPRGAPRRYTDPRGPGYHGRMRHCWSPHFADDVNQDDAFVYAVAQRLKRGDSVLAVAKKRAESLSALQDAVAHATRTCGAGSVPILIIDDECDEASVSGSEDAPTPDRILSVWEGVEQHALYIGLTATPAANLLQETNSALFPKDFVELLKVPAEKESATSFFEPDPDRRYSGGEVFYDYLEARSRPNFLVRAKMSDAEFSGQGGSDAELSEALIAYFVAGAIRLASSVGAVFTDEGPFPAPHTMLAHTEALVEDHWALCARVLEVIERSAGVPPAEARDVRRTPPDRRLKQAYLRDWLQREEPRWRDWYKRFEDSRDVLLAVTPDRSRPSFPKWEAVRGSLPDVFSNTKLRVLNSDETGADPSLDYTPSYSGEKIEPPYDIYSIVIGGNRLSRGLTLAGLCISYYTRSTETLAEDTTVQRERWFGYRGGHLEFCRLFTHPDLAIRLGRFSYHDQDLREQLARNVAEGRAPIGATFRFLRLRDSTPTAKLGRGTPGAIEVAGARLFFDKLEMGFDERGLAAAANNEQHAACWSDHLLAEGEPLGNKSKGTVAYCVRDIPADELADMLDKLQYSDHCPDPTSGIPAVLRDFYRVVPPGQQATRSTLSLPNDPYLLAAYLRYWSAAYKSCCDDPTLNRFRGPDGLEEWSPTPPPIFNLAVRLGSLEPEDGSPFHHALLNRAVDSTGNIGSRWGGHGYGNAGDEWIDVDPPGDPTAPRAKGSPGLALLHVIGRQATGRDGMGSSYRYDRPTFGVAIPEGGPSLVFVVTDGEA